jgi:Cupin domain
MEIVRREFLRLSSLTVVVPSIADIAPAQAPAGPKLTQILRNDLEGQAQVVQETVVSIVEFPPGTAAPWHMHPGAQELLHVIEGSLIVEIEGKHAPQGRRSRDHFRRTGSPRSQRERKRERQSVGCPHQSGKGQTSDCPRKEIALSIEIRITLKQRRSRRVVPYRSSGSYISARLHFVPNATVGIQNPRRFVPKADSTRSRRPHRSVIHAGRRLILP